MPRLVFLGYPVRGHTAPSLPVVAELTRRGAQVDYYSLPGFRSLVEDAGARFSPYPGETEELLTAPVDSSEHLARTLAAAEMLLPSLLADLDTPPDLVLFDASALWGSILARRLGRPSVCSITTFAFNRPLLQMTGAPAPARWSQPIFDRLNATYDAGLRDHLDMMAPKADLKIVHTSRAFQPTGRFFDGSHMFVGPQIEARPRDGAPARAIGPRPLAYVSLGTLFNRDHALLLRISQVLVAAGWQVIVSMGDAAHDASLAWPQHVQAFAFVDQIGVLAQAQLFVTHGGMNSVSEALAHAVPMIVTPQAVDQHLVARQTANLGAALVVEPDGMSTQSLSMALETLERDRPAFVDAASRLQRSFAEAPTIASAVERMLGLLGRNSGDA
ncbi:MAG: nucleotide disphospho-sugar-binding domain-containing protein [Caulobacter sp.]